MRVIHTSASSTYASTPFYAWRHVIHEILQPSATGSFTSSNMSAGDDMDSDWVPIRLRRRRAAWRRSSGAQSPLQSQPLMWDASVAEAAVMSVLTPQQKLYAWLLNEVIPVSFPVNNAVREFTPRERRDKLLELLASIITTASKDLLRGFRCGERLLIVLEYGDYLDADSICLLSTVRSTAVPCAHGL